MAHSLRVALCVDRALSEGHDVIRERACLVREDVLYLSKTGTEDTNKNKVFRKGTKGQENSGHSETRWSDALGFMN